MQHPVVHTQQTWFSELKHLLQLMWPILITQFAQAGLGLIDTIMAGRLSAHDLAAIAIGVGIWIPIMLLFSGIMIATTPLVAEAKGAQNQAQIVRIVQQSLRLGLILGVLALLLLQLMPYTLGWMGVPISLQPKAGLFLHAIGLGMPAVTLYAALRGYSEALGHPRPITVISLLALPTLIPLNLMFMYGWGPIPALGSAGCGFATAILQWLMLATLTIYVFKARAYKSTWLFGAWSKPDWALIQRIFKLGLPIGLAIFFEVSIFSTGAIVLSPLGDTVVAAHQIAISVTSQLFMIPMSLAIALTICVGTHFGEQNRQRLIVVQWMGLLAATVFAVATMILIAVARPEITGLYTEDAAVFKLAMYLLLFAMAYQLMDAWQVSAAGCLRGMQDTQAAMWITLLAYWVVAFPLGVYLARYTAMAAAGVWVGLIVGLSVACVLLLARLHQQQRRFKGKTR